MNKTILFASIIIMLIFSSCATIFTGTTQDIYFDTGGNPSRIYINGVREATGSSDITIRKSYKTKVVEVKQGGYEPLSFELEKVLNPVTLLNFLGFYGFLIDIPLATVVKYESYYNVELTPIESQDTSDTEDQFFNIEDTVYTVVERMPAFPGGEKALASYLKKNVKYPPKAIKKKIQGRVYIEFVVAPSGKIINVKTLKSVHPLLDTEAVRVIKSMPAWTPGMQRGKNVHVSYRIPINFNL